MSFIAFLFSDSAPDLNVVPRVQVPLRHASSSTELLYERAMARFYKAVEIEEQETQRRSMSVDIEARRRSFSVDDSKVHNQITKDIVDKPIENEKSILKRRFPNDTMELKLKLPKQFESLDDETENSQMSETTYNTKQNEINTPDNLANMLSSTSRHHEEDFYDDYTASTISSADEGEYEFEKDDEEIPTRRSQKRGGDLKTYHPPRMLSPYRAPDMSEAAAVLTKPLNPLPDPNFKPKPILKRPASADGRKPAPSKRDDGFISNLLGRRSVSPCPLTSKQHRKSVEIDVVPKIMFESPPASPTPPEPPAAIKTENIVKIEPKKIEEPKRIVIETHEIIQPPAPASPKPQPKVTIAEEPTEDPEIIRRREIAKQRSEENAKKMLQLRQASLEETKVVADFYGDIIKDVSRPITKPKVPIYMDPEALKKLQMEEDDDEEKTENDSGITSSTDLSPSTSMSRPFSPTRGILQQVKPQINNQPIVAAARTFSPPPPPGSRVLSTASVPKTATMKNELNSDDVDVDIDKEKLINEIQTRGRTIIPKSTVNISSGPAKRRDQSHSRTRDSSLARSELATKSPTESTILRRREKSQSRTRNRSESKSPSAMNRKIIINKVVSSKGINDNPSASTSTAEQMTTSRPMTPNERQEEVDLKVKSSLTSVTDVTIFVFAAYLYFFKSAILALPILTLLIYRQISDKLSWFKKKKS